MVYDVHAHIFNKSCVPRAAILDRLPEPSRTLVKKLLDTYDDFTQFSNEVVLGKWIMAEYLDPKTRFHRLAVAKADKAEIKITRQTLHRILGFRVKDLLEFLHYLGSSIAENGQRLADESAADEVDCVIVLPMDMKLAYSGAPGLATEYPDQLEMTFQACRASGGRLKMFVGFDPRRDQSPTAMELLKKYYDDGQAAGGIVAGVKFYPSLGCLPHDERYRKPLDEMYAFCVEHNLPITSHCLWGDVLSDLPAKDEQGNALTGKALKDHYRRFNAPGHWSEVLDKYPTLKVNLAHFGGLDGWEANPAKNHPAVPWPGKILQMMGHYPNLYTDLSYHHLLVTGDTAQRKDYKAKLLACLGIQSGGGPFAATIPQRIMLGTDVFMVLPSAGHSKYWASFKKMLTAAQFKMVADSNISQFLTGPPVVKMPD